MRGSAVMLAAGLLLGGCDDGGGGGAPGSGGGAPGSGGGVPGSGGSASGGGGGAAVADGAVPDPDGTPPADGGGGAVDAGVEAPDCERICGTLTESCGDALVIRGDCGDCERIAAGVGGAEHPETYARAARVCAAGVAAVDCKALYACVSDDDGLSASGGDVRVEIRGAVGEEMLDIAVDDAWAFVGTKNDGSPSDLEVALFAEGIFYVVRFDDLAAAADLAPLDAARHAVEIESVAGEIRLEVGEIFVDRFALDGEFAVRATVGARDTTGEVAINVDGAFD